MKLERTWTKSQNSLSKTFWELGDDQWHLQSDGSIQSCKILSRKILSKDPFTLVEEILIQPETPVPLEAQVQEAKGWSVKEIVPLLPTPIPPTAIKSSIKNSSEKDTPDAVCMEMEGTHYSITLPTELWLSLSQWIPTNALFQPSLHHQAVLELSDSPTQVTKPYARYSINNNYGQKQRIKTDFSQRPLFI